MPRSASRLSLALSLSVLGFACGGDVTLPNQGEPATVEILDGDGQNGTVGEALSESLVVLVTDRFGDPVPDAVVQWTAQDGGTVDPGESTTDSEGRASTRRILGTEPNTYFTIASVAGIDDVVRFTSTALTARLVLTSRLQAIAVSGVPLDPQPTLQLQNADGSPIAREAVGEIVDMSTTSASSGSAAAAPWSPNSTCSTSGTSGTIVTNASASWAASAGVAAAVAPCSAAKRSAFSRVRV